MDFKKLFKRASSRSLIILFIASIFFFSSCQKDALVTPEPSPSATLNTTTAVPENANITASTTNSLAATITGTYTSSAPLVLKNKSNMTISGLLITGGTSACISLTNCTNIHITDCKLQNGTTVTSTGVNLVGCTGITIDNNFITKVSTGVFAQNSTGVVVNSNQFLNMVGPYPRGAYVQFSGAYGAGNKVTNNTGENIAGQSNPEDGINMYKSNGTAASPILISGNKLRGGGPSTTGSGITVGDQGGSYITVTNNTAVNTGNIGMQIAGGTYITMSNNTIYSTATSISHLGLGYGNFSGKAIGNNTVSNNKVKWMCGKASDLAWYPKGTTSVEKDASVQSGLAAPAGWSTNALNAAVTASVLPTTMITMK